MNSIGSPTGPNENFQDFQAAMPEDNDTKRARGESVQSDLHRFTPTNALLRTSPSIFDKIHTGFESARSGRD